MKKLWLLIVILGTILPCLAQVAPQTEKVGPITQASQQRQETWKKQQESLIEDSERKLRGMGSETDDVLTTDSIIYLPEPKLSKEQKLLITPSQNDTSKFAELLKLPKTGVFKILPDLCGNKRVINVADEKCLNNNYNQLSFYSFRKKLYGSLDWTDVGYRDNSFLVGLKKLTIGIIANLGNVQIDSLDINSPQVAVILNRPMPKSIEKVESIKKEIEQGFETEKLKFSNHASINLNDTYLLRSYAYRTRGMAANDKRIDIIVAFQIVALDENQGLTIVWKEIYRGSTHQI